jgi:hypothetical protein
MSVTRKLLLGLGGAAVVATGVASTANAQTVAAGAGACEVYAREYAAVYAPQFGLFGWNKAYRHGYNECLAGGPSVVSADPMGIDYRYGYAHRGPFAGFGAALAAPVVAAGNIAGAAVNAGASIAGAALSIPGAILGGTAAALDPMPDPVMEVEPAAAPAPVVSKNYRGTYETPAVTSTVAASTSALAVPADTMAMAQGTPEWNAYCAAKYRSFDPATGMYLAFSGTYRMCS